MWAQISFRIFALKSYICFKTSCPNILSNISSNFCFYFLYKFCHMSFIFLQNFYTNISYLNIFVQIIFLLLFICIYFVYNFIRE
jgi:hypothetical protein